MAAIGDIMGILEKIPLWKKLSELPKQVDALEQRLAQLEKKPNLPICEKCGVGYTRLDRTEPLGGPFSALAGAGVEVKVYKCDNEKCGLVTKKGPSKGG